MKTTHPKTALRNIFDWIVFIFLLATGCAPTAVSSPGFDGIIGDVVSKPGEVREYKDNNTVTIGAGWVRIGERSYWNAWYVIDHVIGTSWFLIGEDMNEIDCCKLKNLPEAADYLSFLTTKSCEQNVE